MTTRRHLLPVIGLLAAISAAGSHSLGQSSQNPVHAKNVAPSPFPYSRRKVMLALRDKNNETAHLTLVAAHRGYWETYPENSWEAIELAGRTYEMVEADIKPLADETPVVNHDLILNRTTTGSGLVTQMMVADFRKLYLKDRHGVVTRIQPMTAYELIDKYAATVQTHDPWGGFVLALDVKAERGDPNKKVWSMVEKIYKYAASKDPTLRIAESILFKVEAVSMAATSPQAIKTLIDEHPGHPLNLCIVLNPPANPEDKTNDTVVKTYSDKGYVATWEVNYKYSGSDLGKYLEGTSALPGAIGTFSTYYDLPTGVGTSNAICCSTVHTDVESVMSVPYLTAAKDLNGRLEVFDIGKDGFAHLLAWQYPNGGWQSDGERLPGQGVHLSQLIVGWGARRRLNIVGLSMAGNVRAFGAKRLLGDNPYPSYDSTAHLLLQDSTQFITSCRGNGNRLQIVGIDKWGHSYLSGWEDETGKWNLGLKIGDQTDTYSTLAATQTYTGLCTVLGIGPNPKKPEIQNVYLVARQDKTGNWIGGGRIGRKSDDDYPYNMLAISSRPPRPPGCPFIEALGLKGKSNSVSVAIYEKNDCGRGASIWDPIKLDVDRNSYKTLAMEYGNADNLQAVGIRQDGHPSLAGFRRNTGDQGPGLWEQGFELGDKSMTYSSIALARGNDDKLQVLGIGDDNYLHLIAWQDLSGKWINGFKIGNRPISASSDSDISNVGVGTQVENTVMKPDLDYRSRWDWYAGLNLGGHRAFTVFTTDRPDVLVDYLEQLDLRNTKVISVSGGVQ